MLWRLHVGDILDVQADVLVCSANVSLNLSGGVGGAFALRYGPAMQVMLHDYLKQRGLHFVAPGTVIDMPSCGSPYRAVLHAVAVDGAYQSSSDRVAEVVGKSLKCAAASQARVIALSAVGTGYGRLSLKEFATGLVTLMHVEFPPLEQVILGVRSAHDAEELSELLPLELS